MLNPSFAIYALVGCYFLCYTLASNLQLQVGEPVSTTSGRILGHAAPNSNQVSEYLGIPFAQPPIGNLRFAAPVRYTGNGDFDAAKFGLACPQEIKPPLNSSFRREGPNTDKFFNRNSVGENEIGEDCLSINIWTKPGTGNEKKAVFAFIHGGAMEAGASRLPVYNGQYIADQEDVVVATFNYRLNVFGFPGIPELSQNAGLLDQRMAIEWLRDNIAAFGGDPSRIVIAGQSAGATSVDYYTYAWKDDPIVAGFIAESGTANRLEIPALGATGVAPNSIEAWYSLSSALGCGNSSAGFDSTISCVRGKHFTDVINAIPENTSGAAGGSFYPTIDNKVVFGDYDTLGSQGQFSKKPYLLGNNDNESGYFQALQYAEGVYEPQIVWDIFNTLYTCQTLSASKWRTDAQAPVWRYRYFGAFEQLRLFDKSGAYHAEELPVYFGTSEALTDEAPRQELVDYGNFLRKMFMNFAKDPENAFALSNMQLPTFDPKTDSLIRLAYPGAPPASIVNPNRYDYPCYSLIPLLEKQSKNKSLNAACQDKATPEAPWGAFLCEINSEPATKDLVFNSTPAPTHRSSGDIASRDPSNGAAPAHLAQAGPSALLAMTVFVIGIVMQMIVF